MRYLSVCSGIEAATQAWSPLGWEAVAFSEIEPFPCAVLAHHYPDVPNWGDMTKFQDWPNANINVLCGGTPCQSFSVAGLRKGLADPRGNLMLTFGAIAGRYRPQWVVWENVPGVLSSNGGRDFGAFLGMLGQLGYGVAYRVLDAQHVRTRRFPFAVPQRRRRVFVVGYLGDWRRAAAVLFDRESLSGHPAPRRSTGQGVTHDVAPCLTSSGRGVERTGDTRGQDPVIGLQTFDRESCKQTPLAFDGFSHIATDDGSMWTLSTKSDHNRQIVSMPPSTDLVAHTLKGEGYGASEDGTGRQNLIAVHGTQNPITQEECAFPIGRNAGQETAMAYAIQERAVSENLAAGPGGMGVKGDGTAYTLEARQRQQAVAFKNGEIDANAHEADASSVLSALRREVGEEAFAEWRSAIIAALQSPEVLQSWLHGKGLREQAEETRPGLDDSTLPRAENMPEGSLRKLWEVGPDGRSPQGRELAQQLARELGASLPIVPHSGAPWAVRRLTPKEAERLQGFPDGFTDIPWRKKPHSPDGPRYKALGNSWAVNCAEWIGERIAEVDTWH